MPDLTGHAVRTEDGWVVFDPPAAPGVVAGLRALGPVAAILLTGAHHDRAAGALRARIGMPPIFAPRRDREVLLDGGCLVDQVLDEGDQAFGFEVIDLPEVGRFGAESAFFAAGRRLLVISDLLVVTETAVACYGQAFGVDVPSRLLGPYLERLARLEPETLLAGHGLDIVSAAAAALRQLAAMG